MAEIIGTVLLCMLLMFIGFGFGYMVATEKNKRRMRE